MKAFVEPPVDEAVREALVEALPGVVDARSAGYDDAWRRASLEDGISRAERDSDYALSPRSTRGATRA